VWAHGTPEPDQLCRRVLDDLVVEAGRDDDSVVVTARVRREPVSAYETTLPAIPDTVAVVRRGLGEWLTGTGMSAVDSSSLMQAAIELVTNAVEHAYPTGTDHRRTEVRVHGSLDGDGMLRLEVADGGRWASDGEPTIPVTTEPGGLRGRGLFLARAFVDRLSIEAGEAGTVACIEHRPVRPPVLLTAVGGPPPAASSAGQGFRTEHIDGVLYFTGAVDATVTDDFRLLVGRASRGGVSPLVLDLSRVTALASGAVGALVELGAGVRDGALHLVAEPGTTAHTVLELSGLPVH
jgi:anti-sigma regulatory factor (Ser/Thr protein kinase)/anti-anti-sigma regulatory factor